MNEAGPGDIARNHKKRALENVKLMEDKRCLEDKNADLQKKNASQEDKIARLRAEMQRWKCAAANGAQLPAQEEKMEIEDTTTQVQQPAVAFDLPADKAANVADSCKTTREGGEEEV